MLNFKQFNRKEINEATSIFGGLEPKWGKGGYENGPKNHGARPLGNWQSDNAWDIFAKPGTPVYAITSGEVTKVKVSNKTTGKIFGTQISVNSNDGNPNVFYTHLKNVVVKRGDNIKAGDKIGEISEWDDAPSITHVHIGLSGGKHIRDIVSEDGVITGAQIFGPDGEVDYKRSSADETSEIALKWDDKYTDTKSSQAVLGFLDFLKAKRKEALSGVEGANVDNLELVTLLTPAQAGKAKSVLSQAGQDDPAKNSGNWLSKIIGKKKGESTQSVQSSISPVSGSIVAKGNASSNASAVKVVVDALNKYGIVNPITQKAILSVIGKESGFKPRNEISYSGTSNDRIRMIFGSRVSKYTDSELTNLKKDPVKFWDVVYGGRYGNDSPGDGAKYLGRGFNGLTFKGNYKKYNDLLKKHGNNVDIVNNPEKVNDLQIAAEVNALYFLENLSSKWSKKKYGNSDPNDFRDFDTALKAATNANAGWGNNIEGSRALRKAQEYASNFDVLGSEGSKLA